MTAIQKLCLCRQRDKTDHETKDRFSWFILSGQETDRAFYGYRAPHGPNMLQLQLIIQHVHMTSALYTGVNKHNYIIQKTSAYVCGRQNCDTCNKQLINIMHNTYKASTISVEITIHLK